MNDRFDAGLADRLDQVEEPDAEIGLQRRIKAGVAVAVLLTGLLALLSWRMAQQAVEDTDGVTHSHEVSVALELTLRHLDDVETGERGFALTGEQPFLEPYESGKSAVVLDLQRLRKLIGGDSEQQQRLVVLVRQVTARLEATGELVATAKKSGTIPTAAALTWGKQLMDAVRTTVEAMEEAEQRLLEQRTRRARITRQLTGSAIGLGAIFGAVFLTIAGTRVSQEVGVSATARAQIKALNADLEQRVEQRTAALQSEVAVRMETQERLAAQTEELLRSQQALETQTFMLRSVLDSMVEGLIAADEQGKFILWNPAAEKILGLGATDLPPSEWSTHYGTYLADKVTPIAPGQTPLERAILGVVSSTEIFLRNPALDREVWLETNSSPLRSKDGVLRGGVAAFRDITRRKADELEIRKLNEELEEKIANRTEQLEAANRELEAFSYSVSHDLRTPLRHIAGFSRILANELGPGLPGEAREHLQRIEDAVRRMGLLVDALLSMAVLRRQSLRLHHTELNPIIAEVISVLQPECEGRDVEWRIAQLPALDCDPVLMGQVFQNLLSNALKYSRGRSRAVIEVDSIQQPDKPAVILVRDNGVGFDMKYAQKLFGMFQRMHTESEFEGTGVGLATVHRIIQKHGGIIWAEAEPDHGATFYFALQASEQVEVTPNATAFSLTWPNRQS